MLSVRLANVCEINLILSTPQNIWFLIAVHLGEMTMDTMLSVSIHGSYTMKFESETIYQC